MACVDCFNNCDFIQSDKCIKYTGPDIPCLDICTGDNLSKIEGIIFSKLCAVVDGTGITLSEFAPCTFVGGFLVGDKTIDKITQALNDAICELKEEVDSLAPGTITVDADCLSLPPTPTRDDILKATAETLCLTKADTDAIKADYVKASELCDLVEDCLSGGGGLVQENTKMPKYCPIPYYGPLTVFDGAGNGLLAFGYDKVYLCLGQTINGFVLPDMRGRVPVGVNNGVPGGALDGDVDPSLPQNAGYAINKGTKKGNYTHALTASQGPAHSHGVNDPGHTHSVSTNAWPQSGSTTDCYSPRPATPPGYFTSFLTNSNSTGITINSSGNSQPHNNTQPSIGVYYIMYVPS